MNVVTVAVDNMYFKAGARVNDTIVLIGRLTHVGRSSMEVRIDTYCEALDGTRTMINRAYLLWLEQMNISILWKYRDLSLRELLSR